MEYLSRAIQELEQYLPPLTRRPDFDAFWERTLGQAQAQPLEPQMLEAESPFPGVKVYDISYCGFDQTRIHGWFLVPAFLGKAQYPCLVHYHGFNGSRGKPWDYAQWLLMGLAVLAVDCREQCGDTGNAAAYTCGAITNVVCKGILSKEEYYYRAVYMDCVKALDFALQCPQVDPGKLVIEGGSQGGALGMAVCCLDQRPALALVDVPSNSNLEARVEGAHGSFTAVQEYLKRYPSRCDQAYETLSYFDTMNMAQRIRCPILASVALKDPVCPAKCYYASYNRIPSAKEIRVYPFNGHEGGGSEHTGEKIRFLKKQLKAWEARKDMA